MPNEDNELSVTDYITQRIQTLKGARIASGIKDGYFAGFLQRFSRGRVIRYVDFAIELRKPIAVVELAGVVVGFLCDYAIVSAGG